MSRKGVAPVPSGRTLSPSDCLLPWASSGLDADFPDPSGVRMTWCDCMSQGLIERLCFSFRFGQCCPRRCPSGSFTPSFTEEPEALAVSPRLSLLPQTQRSPPPPLASLPTPSPSPFSCPPTSPVGLGSVLSRWGQGSQEGQCHRRLRE